jgi:hypothetical protein
MFPYAMNTVGISFPFRSAFSEPTKMMPLHCSHSNVPRWKSCRSSSRPPFDPVTGTPSASRFAISTADQPMQYLMRNANHPLRLRMLSRHSLPSFTPFTWMKPSTAPPGSRSWPIRPPHEKEELRQLPTKHARHPWRTNTTGARGDGDGQKTKGKELFCCIPWPSHQERVNRT